MINFTLYSSNSDINNMLSLQMNKALVKQIAQQKKIFNVTIGNKTEQSEKAEKSILIEKKVIFNRCFTRIIGTIDDIYDLISAKIRKTIIQFCAEKLLSSNVRLEIICDKNNVFIINTEDNKMTFVVNAHNNFDVIFVDNNGNYTTDKKIDIQKFGPCKVNIINSGFSNKRVLRDINNKIISIKPHHGVDFHGKIGDPVFAVEDGTVCRVRKSNLRTGYGNVIEINHGNGYKTLYAHLSRFNNLPIGATVKKGQIIGFVGNTGESTGPHLHFEIQYKNIPQNPENKVFYLKSQPDIKYINMDIQYSKAIYKHFANKK